MPPIKSEHSHYFSMFGATPLWATDEQRLKTYRDLSLGTSLVDDRLWRLVYVAPQTSDAWIWRGVPQEFTFAGGQRESWPPPIIKLSDGRLFEEQSDGYFCGMHAVNNLAGSHLLTPRIMLETEIAMRGKDVSPSNSLSLYAQTSELFVAALRRGVVLAPVSLASRFQSWPLRFSPSGCFIDIVTKAGGLVLLFPSVDNTAGHYQPVVATNDDSNTPGATRWLSFSGKSVVARANDLPTLLGQLLRWHTRGASTPPVVGFVPLEDSTNNMTVRLWRRSILANAHVVDKRIGSNAALEVELSEYSPLTINSACAALQGFDDPGRLPINAFTFFAAQHRFEDELNDLCNQLAANAVRFGRLTSTTSDISRTLRQIASLMLSPTCVGLLFGGVGVLSTANWLRYCAVGLVARRLVKTIATATGPNENLYRLAVYLALVGWTYHEEAGATPEVNRERYAAIQEVYRESALRPDSLLPPLSDYYQHNPSAATATTTASGLQTPQDLFIDVSFEKSTWLLQLAVQNGLLTRAEVPPISPHNINTLRAIAFARAPVVDRANIQLESRANAAYADERRKGEQMGMRGDALGDAADEAKFAVRRIELQPLVQRYYQTLDTIVGSALLQLFGASRRYQTGETSGALINADFDRYQHVLEQLYVRLGIGSIYGLVYDLPGKLHTPDTLANNKLFANGAITLGQPRAETPFTLSKRTRE